jgi:hypothetical protein
MTLGGAPMMKVLVATNDTQGQRDNDFSYCIEGELVTVGLVCAADEQDPDGGCGCGRAFAGLNSHKATTTAKVKDVELSEDDYVEALRSSLEQQGWPTEDVTELATWLVQLVSTWPIGAVIERRLDDIYIRTEAQSAR